MLDAKLHRLEWDWGHWVLRSGYQADTRNERHRPTGFGFNAFTMSSKPSELSTVTFDLRKEWNIFSEPNRYESLSVESGFRYELNLVELNLSYKFYDLGTNNENQVVLLSLRRTF